MAHRDEVEALRARIEAQERDLRDAKAELDVLLAAARANAAAAHAGDESSSTSAPRGASPGLGFGFGPTSGAGPFDRMGDRMGEPQGPASSSVCSPLAAETQRRVGLLILLVTTLVAGLFISTTRYGGGRGHHCGSRARAIGPSEISVAPPVSHGDRFDPFVRFARVIEPGVPAAVAADQMCAIEVTPVDDGTFDCRVVVRCDDLVLYGESPEVGFNHCGPVPSRIVDNNHSRVDRDPALEIDLASGSVVIEERVGLGMQRVELQIVE